MAWQILHNFDVEGGKVSLNERVPCVEIKMAMDAEVEYAMVSEQTTVSL